MPSSVQSIHVSADPERLQASHEPLGPVGGSRTPAEGSDGHSVQRVRP